MDDCQLCGARAHKVICAGIPLKLCSNEDCNCVWGFWSWIFDLLPFNGYFMIYRKGYLDALWHWLTEPLEER